MSHEEQQTLTINEIAAFIKAFKKWWLPISGIFSFLGVLMTITALVVTRYNDIPKKKDVASKEDITNMKATIESLTIQVKTMNESFNGLKGGNILFKDSVKRELVHVKTYTDNQIKQVKKEFQFVYETFKTVNGQRVISTHPN